jgi:hypothetical protein
MKTFNVLVLMLFGMISFSCDEDQNKLVGTSELNKPLILVDINGETWDVTYGRDAYGMTESGYAFGIGRDAFIPINDPIFLSPEDEGYPDKNDPTLVLGFTYQGVSRAYALPILISHEVVNDRIRNTHFSATY